MTGRGRVCAPLFILGGLLLAALGHAGDVREVGFVERFSGEPGDHRILRGGQAIPVAVFAPLEVGDRISVRAPGEQLALRVGGRLIELTTESEERVLAEGPEGTLTTNLAVWVGEWISGGSGPDATRIALSTRSVALAAPSWGEGPALLVAGTRSLRLVWRGGHPPYAVELQRLEPRGGRVGAWSVEDDAQLVTPGVELLEGLYRLSLRDAAGGDVTLPLRVVGALPKGPVDGDQPLDRTLFAAWLADRGAGEWRLEAYQRLAPLRESYPPAALLADALESGVSIPTRP